MLFKYPVSFARFYDTIYHSMRDSTDSDFFGNQIINTKGKILEIGVGTGRLFMNSLDAGADIYGLDISDSMLDILRKKLKKDQHYRISLQNITDFRLDIKFDLVVAPFRVLMHLIEKEEQIKSINNVYDHLDHNGRFIFDVFVPDLTQLINGLHDVVDFDGEYAPGRKLKRTVSTTPDLMNQLINIKFHLQWDEENGMKEEEYWYVPMRYFFRFELEHLVERSRFESYKIIGDYEGNELNQNSKEFIVICQKK